MNNKTLGIALFLSCASLLVAQTQEPSGHRAGRSKSHVATTDAQEAEISGKLPKRKVLDLRKKKHTRATDDVDSNSIPVIASPIYLPQGANSGTAITASNGFLYIVEGQKLFKVNEKTLKTVQVSQLGHTLIEPAIDRQTPKRRKKLVASTDDEPTTDRNTTKKHHSSKAD